LEGVTLTLLIVLGTGLRVTAELGGGISLWEDTGVFEVFLELTAVKDTPGKEASRKAEPTGEVLSGSDIDELD
jgi:hypothetical protein